jgi:hypothetical protein
MPGPVSRSMVTSVRTVIVIRAICGSLLGFLPPPPRRLGTSPVQRAEGGKHVFLSLGRSPGEMSRYETEGAAKGDLWMTVHPTRSALSRTVCDV